MKPALLSFLTLAFLVSSFGAVPANATLGESIVPEKNGTLKKYAQKYWWVHDSTNGTNCSAYSSQEWTAMSGLDDSCIDTTLILVNHELENNPDVYKMVSKKGYRVIIEASHHFTQATSQFDRDGGKKCAEYSRQDPDNGVALGAKRTPLTTIDLNKDFLFIRINCDSSQDLSTIKGLVNGGILKMMNPKADD